MKKYILLFMALIASLHTYAIEDTTHCNVDTSDLNTSPWELYCEYNNASPARKCEIDSIMQEFEDYYKSQQIKSICGVKFGTSYENALPILKHKFGEPSSYSDSKTIQFEKIRYARIDFDNVFFMFQSDGFNTYLNACIFAKSFKEYDDAIEFLKNIKIELKSKYTLLEDELERNEIFGTSTIEILKESHITSCGVSPLWDGDWKTLLTNALQFKYTIQTDIVTYDENIDKDLGVKFGARLIYGPYEYVKEEF